MTEDCHAAKTNRTTRASHSATDATKSSHRLLNSRILQTCCRIVTYDYPPTILSRRNFDRVPHLLPHCRSKQAARRETGPSSSLQSGRMPRCRRNETVLATPQVHRPSPRSHRREGLLSSSLLKICFVGERAAKFVRARNRIAGRSFRYVEIRRRRADQIRPLAARMSFATTVRIVGNRVF